MDTFTAANFIFTLSYFVGLFPYGRTSSPLPKRHRILFLAVNLIQFGLVLGILWIDIFQNKIYATNDAFRFSRRIISKIAFVFSLVERVFWQVRHPRGVPKIIGKILRIKKYLGTHNFTCFNIFIASFGLVSTVVPLTAGLFDRVGPYDALAGFLTPLAGNVMFLSQFYAFLEVIRSLLQDLNKRLTLAADLRACISVHAEICSIVKDLSQMHYSQLMMGFIVWLINLLTTSFQIFGMLVKTGEPYPGFTVTLPIFFISQTLQMWSICHICQEVHYESDIFSDILSSTMRKQCPSFYDRKLILYSVMRPNTRITCFNLFTVDTGILATILGTVVTYFIVLVQMYS